MPLESSVGINPFLLPFSFLYGIGVRFRNQLFDWGLLHTEQFPFPVICIGNLTVGGTGKTPHTEYLINLLKDTYRVAVVSRGYKRKTNGYILATTQSTSNDIGDEPFQMKRKYPELIVAVDGNRCRAIRQLMELSENERPQVILLDDAYQHRYVTPSFSILLTDYNRRYYFDRLLPLGRLREPKCGRRRANMVVVTKCEPSLKPIEYRVIESEIDVMDHQNLFFTGIKYGNIVPVFANANPFSLINLELKGREILLVSGIASPALFIEEVQKYSDKVTTMNFPDHHIFKKADIKKIKEVFGKLLSPDKIILVTEKDAARLADSKEFPEEVKPFVYYMPIEVGFRLNQEPLFKELVINHVESFERNRILTQQ